MSYPFPKAKDITANLNKIKRGREDIPCYYGTDDEGNSFAPVLFAPSLKFTHRDYALERERIDGMMIFDTFDEARNSGIAGEDIMAIAVIN